jgi:hypothetical protein
MKMASRQETVDTDVLMRILAAHYLVPVATATTNTIQSRQSLQYCPGEGELVRLRFLGKPSSALFDLVSGPSS